MPCEKFATKPNILSEIRFVMTNHTLYVWSKQLWNLKIIHAIAKLWSALE